VNFFRKHYLTNQIQEHTVGMIAIFGDQQRKTATPLPHSHPQILVVGLSADEDHKVIAMVADQCPN
jgi:hypothetical protein